jgi:hypothetical protein
MKTRMLMISSSTILAVAGLLVLFAPEEVLGLKNIPETSTLPVLLQIMGALYFSLAIINWTAKDSQSGGIYLRSISVGNFAHFFVGALVLGKFAFSNSQNMFVLAAMSVYAFFSFFFWQAAFRSQGQMDGN